MNATINPRRRTASARSKKPLLKIDSVYLVCYEYKMKPEKRKLERNLRSTQSPVCCLTLAGKPAGLFQEMAITEWGLWIIQILSKWNLGPDHHNRPYKEKYLECTTWLEAALEPFHSANSVSHGGAVVDIRKLLKFVFPFSVFLSNVRLICHTADWCWPQKTDNSIVCAFNSLFETCSRRLQFKSYIQSQRILIPAHARLSVFNISCLWFPDTGSKDEEKMEEKLRKSEKTESKAETEEKAAVDQKLGSWELFLLHKAHRMSILWKALVIEWN